MLFLVKRDPVTKLSLLFRSDNLVTGSHATVVFMTVFYETYRIYPWRRRHGRHAGCEAVFFGVDYSCLSHLVRRWSASRSQNFVLLLQRTPGIDSDTSVIRIFWHTVVLDQEVALCLIQINTLAQPRSNIIVIIYLLTCYCKEPHSLPLPACDITSPKT